MSVLQGPRVDVAVRFIITIQSVFWGRRDVNLVVGAGSTRSERRTSKPLLSRTRSKASCGGAKGAPVLP